MITNYIGTFVIWQEKFLLKARKLGLKNSLWKEFMREERGVPSTRGISEAQPRFRVQTPLPHQPFHKLQTNRERKGEGLKNILYFLFYFFKGVNKWLFLIFSLVRFSIKRYFWKPFLCDLIFPKGKFVGALFQDIMVL